MYTGADAPPFARRTALIDPAQRVEIVIDGRDAELDRIEILIGELHVRQNAAEQLGVLNRAAGRGRRRSSCAECTSPRARPSSSQRPFSTK